MQIPDKSTVTLYLSH